MDELKEENRDYQDIPLAELDKFTATPDRH